MERSYFSTLNLLILHEIDAAFWKEWEMFAVPGGIQGFLIFNLIIIPILLIGYRHVALKSDKAVLFSKICAGIGLLAFFIHAGFYVAGFEQFTLPLSAGVIIGCLISGIWQLFHIRSATTGG